MRHNNRVDRENPEGIKRNELTFALRTRRFVSEARRINKCMLCRRTRVNEAGLCEVCYATLEGEELNLALAWLRGTPP